MLVGRAGGALGARIEQPQRFQLVAEEIEPQPAIQARGIDVEDRTAHGKFARIGHGVRPRIALPLEQRDQALAADLHAGLQQFHRFADTERREHPLKRGVDRGDHQLWRFQRCLQAMKRRQPPGGNRKRRAGAIVGQAIPRGEFHHLQLWREEMRGIGDRAHRGVVGSDEHRAMAFPAFIGALGRCRPGEIRQHQRLRPAREARQHKRLGRGKDAAEVGHG